MHPRDRAIGVFDSGVGGLTVFKSLRKRLPSEHLIYFGDTARVPYGSKSKDTVTRYSLEIAKFLERKKIKLLVVACNSASALALKRLKSEISVPVIGVIKPAVRAARKASRSGTIGLIGTEATVLSGSYQRALKETLRSARIVAVACPLFVPFVEEGWWNHPTTKAVAQEYLRPLKRTKMDVLILGCTHYPLLKPLLKKVLGKRIQLIESGMETSREVARMLANHNLKRKSGKGSQTFFVSDGADRFRKLAGKFLRGTAARVQVVRLEEILGA